MATGILETPQKDMCPPLCSETGAFQKVDKNPDEILREAQELRDNTQALVAAAGAPPTQPGPSAAPPPTSSPHQPTSQTPPNTAQEGYQDGIKPPTDLTNPQEYEYLPGLKPGPDGKVDWTPLAEKTGTRPTVNKYSIERYSLEEWRNHNMKVLDPEVLTNANIEDYNGKTAIMRAFGEVDKQQQSNNGRLKQKARDLFRWKTQVELAVAAISDEVEKLEFQRQRLKAASRTLMLPETISAECLDLRSNRAVPDLVSDLAEQELIKEMKMVNDIRTTYKVTLQKIEDQLKINKAAKQKIEYDWCDKTLAYNCDVTNISLNTKSPTIMFRPGAVKFGEYSAPLEYWEYYCRESIANVEEARQKSIDLRGTLEGILTFGGRKLRIQADKTDIAIAETVAITQELLTKLEKQNLDTLQKIVDMENLMEELHGSIRKMDGAMKLAQTRLDNRNNWRPHGENVKDQAHYGLLEEVKKIHETVTALFGKLTVTKDTWAKLKDKRIALEKEIAAKRKTLNIDRERIGMIRSHYPSASELAGD